jgi:rfaE bifunctional protein kinase chain/domain
MHPGKNELSDIVQRFAGRRVLVLADLVLDEYLNCRTSRISREAPAALILRYESREARPGGGANAVANLSALGAEVWPVGAVGDDREGQELIAALQAMKVDTSLVRSVPGYRTVVKSRVLTRYHHSTRQQVLRIDREATLADGPELDAALAAGLAQADRAEALLVSDYGYGVASPATVAPLVERVRARGLPATLDSRYRLLAYKGFTAATPNEPEVEEATGIAIGDDREALERAGRLVAARLETEALLITRGSRGMALFERDQPAATHIPVFGSDEIADVTGAGDTVIAVFTLALAAGASPRQAAELANLAGGLVVMKMGTATVSPGELLAALAGESR